MKLWWCNFSKDQKMGDILTGWQQGAKLKIPDWKLPRNLDWKTLQSYVKEIANGLKNRGSAPPAVQKPRVHMKFPYTFSAQIAQFPYKFYYKNNWIVRTYPWGFALALPIFWYMDRKVNSKENKAKWREIRRKEKEEFKHKFDY
ncbi:uncharacterized protein LOC109545434 [Dendroctonus ponderosae]|uniref:Complex I-B15 n=1 Tax=Dendroctonus ponderosae TaxID=77166 RepID=A0AAR5QER8_DENPD|nr:uncharacterized protein LOC109545434 [Dendroctonus ponderosae]KAH1009644.1 hypothetical protein HUJ04_001972 [Dendroctonus ponderosae]KAH1009645.1 hypothetical protein HUJ04_001972 [Dendroctonus ponderosae]